MPLRRITKAKRTPWPFARNRAPRRPKQPRLTCRIVLLKDRVDDRRNWRPNVDADSQSRTPELSLLRPRGLRRWPRGSTVRLPRQGAHRKVQRESCVHVVMQEVQRGARRIREVGDHCVAPRGRRVQSGARRHGNHGIHGNPRQCGFCNLQNLEGPDRVRIPPSPPNKSIQFEYLQTATVGLYLFVLAERGTRVAFPPSSRRPVLRRQAQTKSCGSWDSA